jgi:hypothetical protein
MNILDFLMQNPVQMQQLAASVDPAPVLAGLDQVAGQSGTYGMADLIMPKMPGPVPMPGDPAAMAQNAPLYPMPQPMEAPKPAEDPKKEARKKLEGVNRSAELAASMTTERPQMLSPGTPAGGRASMNMMPIFSAQPAQAPVSLAQLLGIR